MLERGQTPPGIRVRVCGCVARLGGGGCTAAHLAAVFTAFPSSRLLTPPRTPPLPPGRPTSTTSRPTRWRRPRSPSSSRGPSPGSAQAPPRLAAAAAWPPWACPRRRLPPRLATAAAVLRRKRRPQHRLLRCVGLRQRLQSIGCRPCRRRRLLRRPRWMARRGVRARRRRQPPFTAPSVRPPSLKQVRCAREAPGSLACARAGLQVALLRPPSSASSPAPSVPPTTQAVAPPPESPHIIAGRLSPSGRAPPSGGAVSSSGGSAAFASLLAAAEQRSSMDGGLPLPTDGSGSGIGRPSSRNWRPPPIPAPTLSGASSSRGGAAAAAPEEAGSGASDAATPRENGGAAVHPSPSAASLGADFASA